MINSSSGALVLVGTLCVILGGPAVLVADPPSHSSWELTFSDEFEGTALDLDKWEIQSSSPGHILSSRWPENIEVKDGVVRFLTKKEKRGGREWTTAHTWTRTFKQKYGYFEARIKIGAASGLTNGFWLMGHRYKTPPTNFEINIEAHYPNRYTTNLHVRTDKDWWTKPKSWTAPVDLSKDFHLYGLEWNEKMLVWYFDGQDVIRLPHTICHAEVPVRLSTAILKRAGEITDALDGTAMNVDYVRVYKKK